MKAVVWQVLSAYPQGLLRYNPYTLENYLSIGNYKVTCGHCLTMGHHLHGKCQYTIMHGLSRKKRKGNKSPLVSRRGPLQGERMDLGFTPGHVAGSFKECALFNGEKRRLDIANQPAR